MSASMIASRWASTNACACSAVMFSTFRKTNCMSPEDGSRSTTVMCFPSAHVRVCAVKIFINSEAVRFEVAFALSATIANCLA